MKTYKHKTQSTRNVQICACSKYGACLRGE